MSSQANSLVELLKHKAMRWLRSHIRYGSWLALFALTVQFALSFGHVHFNDTSLRSSLASRALQFAVQPAAALVDSPAAPIQHKPDGLSDDFCAVCSVMQLAGVPAMVPELPVPIGSVHILLNSRVEFAFASSPTLFFRARAPPYA
jgi:hypothetical protein